MVPKELLPKEPSRTISDPPEIGHPNKDRILQLQGRHPNAGQQRLLINKHNSQRTATSITGSEAVL